MTASPLAVYVHIPFCTYKCGYCDFNAYAGLDAVKGAYGRALVREIDAFAPLFEGRTLTSIGFGGGTPSEVPPSHIAAVVEAVRSHAPLAKDAEVTLEANPGTCSGKSLRELVRAGVTRLSLGAQSFDASELRFLDRIHSPEANTAAVHLAREAGFRSVSLDLIYGLPNQTTEGWVQTLREAIALTTDHISTYALTVEEGTPLARKVRRGEVSLPDEDALGDLYEAATDALEAAGFVQYELSNWAKPGHESRHNRAYWIDIEYLGIGAGAHGFIHGERYENAAHPAEYIDRLEAPAGPFPAVVRRYVPDAVMDMSDWLGLRLRLLDGFSPREFSRRFGMELCAAVGPVLDDCAAAGVLDLSPRVQLTRRGRFLHGEVAARFLAHLSAGSQLGVQAP
jgi:oxygen-independent coproporphyrinogen-3 oxidase